MLLFEIFKLFKGFNDEDDRRMYWFHVHTVFLESLKILGPQTIPNKIFKIFINASKNTITKIIERIIF